MTDAAAPLATKGMPHGADAIAIVTLVLGQMDSMKRDILEQIAENARTGSARWQTHEDAHADLAKRLADLKRRVDEHLDDEHERQLVFDTRTAPVRAVVRFLTADKRWMIVFAYIALQFLDDAWTALHGLGVIR